MSAASPSSTLQRFGVVLDGFRRLRASSASSRLAQMAAVVEGFAEIPPATAFNALSVLRVGADEVVHSGVLAWLLDRRAGHGQGPLFLNVLAQTLDLPISVTPADRYLVRREFSGLEAIIDVCVCRPHDFVMYVEHKVWSPEGPHQVDREWHDLQRTGDANGVPTERRYAVFLTPEGRPPGSGDPAPWLCLSHTTLADALRAVLPNVSDAKVAAFVADWIETISQWGTRS